MKYFLRITLKTVAILFVLLNIVVAFHAYKFTHFYDNGSIVIKQQQDKTGWDISKEILFGINAVKQKNTVTADSTFEQVYLKTSDGLKLACWLIPADSARGTVILFHGHGGTRSGVIREAETFNKLGYNSFLVDFRAHGDSEGNTCTIGHKEAEDVKLAYEYVSGKGEQHIILWGISMGASTITKAMKEYDLQPDKVILEMPFGTIEDAVVGRVKMMGLPAQPVATLLTFWGGAEHGFWAYNFRPQDFAAAIKCPTLLQWGANDPRVTRKEEETLFKNLSATNKKFVVYQTSGHESLCKKEPQKWTTELAAFLQ